MHMESRVLNIENRLLQEGAAVCVIVAAEYARGAQTNPDPALTASPPLGAATPRHPVPPPTKEKAE